MANDKDFILKNAIEVGGSTKVTIGDAPTVGSTTVAFDIANLSYDSVVTPSLSSQVQYAAGVAFKPDGTKMYVASAGGTGAGDVFQYSLSTAWDVSTSSYDSVSYSHANITNAYNIQFKPDGTVLYIQGYVADKVYQSTLSTAWDLSTASADDSFFYGNETLNSYDAVISGDGNKMYVSNNDVLMYQYDLNPAWDVSTASHSAGVTLDVSAYTLSDGWYVEFNLDGTKMYGVSGAEIYQFSLSTAWNIGTATYDNITSTLTAISDTGNFAFKADGTKLYQARIGNVYQYTTGYDQATNVFDVSTGNYFATTPSVSAQYDFSNAGDTQTFQLEVTGNQVGYDLANAAYDSKIFSVSGQEVTPNGVTFNTDGTKMFICGSNGDEVNEYALSTSFDISTASFTTNFSVSAQETAPEDIVFKPDGTKMYIIGRTGDDISQYSLSTAYDISTASFDSVSFSVSAQAAFPTGMRFNNDGTKVFICDRNNHSLFQYSLSTAYDISTASYDSVSFDLSAQFEAPTAISLNGDGTKMFTISANTRLMYQYSLSTAFDLSSISYDSVTFALENSAGDPAGMTFNSDGTKMYVADYNTDSVYQYSTATAMTITWDADIQWAGGTAPDSPASGEKDLYTITTDDGGTTYVGVQSGDNFS
mgnify:CR=1 FL=1